MKKSVVLKKLGGVAATARLLKISRASVSGWGEEIPELRAYQLREKRPDLFPPKTVKARARTAEA